MNISLDRKRREKESFEAYKLRLRNDNKALKLRLKGTMVWVSKNLNYKKTDNKGNPLPGANIKPQGTLIGHIK